MNFFVSDNKINNDFIAADTGADTVHDGADNDWIYGMDKDDVLFGDRSNATLKMTVPIGLQDNAEYPRANNWRITTRVANANEKYWRQAA